MNSERKWLFIILLILLVTLSLFYSTKAKITNSLSIWFPENEPTLLEYRRFLEKFGNDEQLVIGLESATPFTLQTNIEKLKVMAKELKSIQGIDVPLGPFSPFLNEKGRRRFLSKDSMCVLIVLPIKKGLDIEEKRHDIVNQVKHVLDKYPYRYHIAGTTAIYERLNWLTRENVGYFFILVFVYMFVLSGLVFRDVKISILTSCTTIITIIILIASFGISGVPINMITSILPVLVLIYGLSDMVYIAYITRISKKTDIKRILFPCFLTSLTTFAGFLSLAGSKIPCVRQLGIFGGIGVMAEFLVTMLLFLAFFKNLKPARPILLHRFHRWEEEFVRKKGNVIIGISVVVFILFAGGMLNLKIDTFTLGMFRKNDVIRQDSEWIEKNIGYYLPMEFLINPHGDFEKIVTIENVLSERGFRCLSLPDFNLNLLSIPGFNILLPEQNYISQDGKWIRFTVMVPVVSAKKIEILMDSIKEMMEEVEGISVKETGYLPLYVKLIDYINRSQMVTFPVSILIVTMIILFIAGWEKGFSGIPPNLLPIVGVLGIMGFFKIYLDVGTIIVVPILIGIAVDDTIHFIYASKQGEIEMIRHPMGITSFILCTGFLFLLLAPLNTVNQFGFLASTGVLIAYFGDSLLLPSLQRLKRIHK